ncbi:MAG: hypothetical protein WCJ64_03365 [Rhodospirillaceae bacterium]
MFAFLTTQSGDTYSAAKIGGSKASNGWWLLLGLGVDEILEAVEVPSAVAKAWRDAVNQWLRDLKPGRRPPQIAWAELAVQADPAWAAKQGWAVAEKRPSLRQVPTNP